MSTNSGIFFKPPQIKTDNNLLTVDNNSRVTRSLAHRPIPEFPPRRLSQIITLIKNGHADAISIMEWLYVFQDAFDWQEEPDQDNDAICLLLWQTIIAHPSVGQIALFKAALYLDGQQDKFPSMLINTMEAAKAFVKKTNALRINWLLALKTENYRACANQALSTFHTPTQYLKALGLPKSAKYRSQILRHSVASLPEYIEENGATWLLECFDEMTQQEILSNCEQLFSVNKSYNELIDTWVKEHCLPDANNSLWFELSESARKTLKVRYKLSNFVILNQIINALCLPEVVTFLGLAQHEITQLQSRSAFWSNYSEQFNQIRILLPEVTAKLMKHAIDIEAEHVITLPAQAGENSEACVFELADKIVVEIFRGEISEIRIFDKSARNEHRLLNNDKLTLKDIRNMAQEYIHDHEWLWQYYCEKLLRTTLKILPNKNTRYFNYVSEQLVEYSFNTGLPTPNKELIKERNIQLEQWNQSFWQQELRSEKYQGMSSFERAGLRDFQMAIQAKGQGDDEQHKLYIQHAANKGHREAMHILGLLMITDPKSSSSIKVAGEQWLCKSAEQGHQPAVEMVTKYNLALNK